MRAHEVEQPLEPATGFPQEASDDCFIAHDKERNKQLRSNGLGQRSLAVSRRTGQQHTMPGLQSVGAQQVPAVLLLHQFAARLQRLGIEEQGFQSATRVHLVQ